MTSRNVVCFLKIPTGNVNLFNINKEESLNCLSNDMIIILVRAPILSKFSPCLDKKQLTSTVHLERSASSLYSCNTKGCLFKRRLT